MNLEEIKNELENLDMNQLDLLIKYIKDKKLLNDYTAIFIDAVEENSMMFCLSTLSFDSDQKKRTL